MNANDIVILDAIIAKKKKESEDLLKQNVILQEEIKTLEKIRRESIENFPSGVAPTQFVEYIPTSTKILDEMIAKSMPGMPVGKLSIIVGSPDPKIIPTHKVVNPIVTKSKYRDYKLSGGVKKIQRIMQFIADSGDYGCTLSDIQKFIFFMYPSNKNMKFDKHEQRGLYCTNLYQHNILHNYCKRVINYPNGLGKRGIVHWVYEGPADIFNTKFYSHK
jgi:hypothetical protein